MALNPNSPATRIDSVCPMDRFGVLSNHTDSILNFNIGTELLLYDESLASDQVYSFQLCVSKPLHPPSRCVQREVTVRTTQAPHIVAR